ncbi:TonB-dependent siderophore receptor [Azospirillum largimobile]
MPFKYARATVIPLAAALLFTTAGVAPARAQSAVQSTARYDIPAGPLADALNHFAQQSGTAIVVDAEKVKGLRSPGLRGSYGVDEGFAALLQGSGYRIARTPAGYVLVPASVAGQAGADGAMTLPEVTVSAGATHPDVLPQAYAGGQVARGGRIGVLGNRDIMDTPFSVTSYTAKKIEDDQATTVADVVAGDPSVRTSGQTGGMLDAFFIRGFPVGEGNLGEISFDGVYGVAPNYRVFADYAERIEVIKGPTALLSGMSPSSSIGGGINIVPKRAADTDLTRLTAEYVGTSQFGGQLDVGRRFGPNGEFGVRFNGSYRGGDTPLDKQSREARVGALALDYRGERLRASLDLLEQKEEFNAPSRPFLIAAGVPVPSAPDGRRNITQPWAWSEVTDRAALLRGEYDLTDSVTVFANAGGGWTEVERLFGTPTILNARGDTSETPEHYKFDVERSTLDAGLRARFDTAMVSHSMTVQASRYHDTLSRGLTGGRAVTSNIYSPVDRIAQSVAAPRWVPKISETDLTGVALSDTLGILDDRVQLVLGVRQQTIKSENFSATTGATTSSYKKSTVTPMAALVLKPRESVTVYANYIEGLSKGDVAPTTAVNAGEALSPYVAKQYEAGVKLDFGQLGAAASLFQITKPSGQLTGNVYSAGGEQRNRGLELSVFGEVAPSVRLLAGVTFIDAELTRTNSAATRGNRPVGVPKMLANLSAEWDTPFLDALTLVGNVAHTSGQYVNVANTQRIPAWTRLDLGARYRTTIHDRPVTIRATVQNVLDTEYWSGVASWGGVSQGAPRTALLSVSTDF